MGSSRLCRAQTWQMYAQVLTGRPRQSGKRAGRKYGHLLAARTAGLHPTRNGTTLKVSKFWWPMQRSMLAFPARSISSYAMAHNWWTQIPSSDTGGLVDEREYTAGMKTSRK